MDDERKIYYISAKRKDRDGIVTLYWGQHQSRSPGFSGNKTIRIFFTKAGAEAALKYMTDVETMQDGYVERSEYLTGRNAVHDICIYKVGTAKKQLVGAR